jgi:hypothetical protein
MIHSIRVHGAVASALRLRGEIRTFLFSITRVARTSIAIVSIPAVSAVTITITITLRLVEVGNDTVSQICSSHLHERKNLNQLTLRSLLRLRLRLRLLDLLLLLLFLSYDLLLLRLRYPLSRRRSREGLRL